MKTENIKSADKGSVTLYYLRIVGVLTLITMSVALLLALVNGMTKDVIAKNEAEKTAAAVRELFPGISEPMSEAIELDKEIEYLISFYSVRDGEGKETAGYYAEVAPVGFKGEVRMIVGLSIDGKVCGVSVLSHGETVGIGDKALRESYLSGFIGLYDKENMDVDEVSGATYTSKAVKNGVKAALNAMEAFSVKPE